MPNRIIRTAHEVVEGYVEIVGESDEPRYRWIPITRFIQLIST